MRSIISLSILVVVYVFPYTAISGNEMPSSTRSREAITGVQPQLKKDFLKAGLTFGAPIYIRIFKQEKLLEVWVKNNHKFHLFKSYPICHFSGKPGPKEHEGDLQSPEGFYFVSPAQLNPYSKFHLSFNLGYPNKYDRSHNRTGSALMVHGSCVSIGCYAMTNEQIEKIYAIADAAFRNSQPFFRVHIFPFRMTESNMREHLDSEWYSFWENLKEGHDLFEQNGFTPPNVDVSNGRYVFRPQ